ncbi:MAG: hypothetical protein ACFFAU_17290 [Candidatus Hodarchaeota archaeon]
MRPSSLIIAITMISLFVFQSTGLMNLTQPIITKDHFILQNKDFTDSFLRNSVATISSTDNNLFLPGTNLSVSEYLYGAFQNTYNVSILTISPSIINIRCDYSITENALGQPFNSPFYTTVNRTSMNDTYLASNYYNWMGLPTDIFDYWIDPSKFDVDYVFNTGETEVTVEIRENITMSGIGEFEAWKLVGEDEYGYPFSIRYDTQSGMFLCFRYEDPLFDLWYNLTQAEIAEIPEDYPGPSLIQISPKNGSSRPNGTKIELSFTSFYGLERIYYKWDDLTNESVAVSYITTIFPETEELHNLHVIVTDGIGIVGNFHFIYITDNKIPGISLSNYKNNSRIKGTTQIMISILYGNGSIIYNWDDVGDNLTVPEDSYITIPSPELENLITLNVYAMNNDTKAWSQSKFVFQIDNTPPEISIFDLINRSIIKGDVRLKVNVSEKGILRYLLHNETDNNITVDVFQNYTLEFRDLDNGSYKLDIFATDEANNTAMETLYFSIYKSAFNWNWQALAYAPCKINVIDDWGDLWFLFTVVSKSDQYFNLTIIPEGSPPTRSDEMQFIVAFLCEKPVDILFVTITAILEESIVKIPIFQWMYWDNQKNSWFDLGTSYSEVTNSWEATYEGYIEYLALVNTGETTVQKSVIPGGGQIPSFEIFQTVLALVIISLYSVIYKRRKLKRKINLR